MNAAALRRLVELAEKADRFSDSPWESRDGSVYDNCGPVVVTNKNIRGAQAKAIAAFIAACDPQTIIALVKLAEAGSATGAGNEVASGQGDAGTPRAATDRSASQATNPALDAERRVIERLRLLLIDSTITWSKAIIVSAQGGPELTAGEHADQMLKKWDTMCKVDDALRASGTRP